MAQKNYEKLLTELMKKIPQNKQVRPSVECGQ